MKRAASSRPRETKPGTERAAATPRAEETEEGGVLPAEECSPRPRPTQPERQVAAQAETSQLPMTGFAAIPVLVGGLALLAGGLILRRRTTN